MTQLPLSNPQKDREMFLKILNDPNLQADQWKIYPCAITPWTKIKKWHEDGIYKPYDDNKLIELLIEIKALVHPWIRLNRIFRDIPSQYISGGTILPNLRQILETKMIKHNKKCKCIRCREVGYNKNKMVLNNPLIVERKYEASGGLEYFISFESNKKEVIYGFLRLRFNYDSKSIFKELKNLALIRELHV
jgi:ELP3 family radical SAM enzyme/protein acetyltransferase